MVESTDTGSLREQVLRRLEAQNVIPTPQRVEVGQILFARPQHLSADQILKAIHKTGSRVSKATVYNTLNLFVERGLVRQVNVDPTRAYYDSTTEPHHHFYNVDTGELKDIPEDEIELKDLPGLPSGTRVDGVQVVVRVRQRKQAAK